MTRLYFTCPIQALYMVKEFGVKFYILGDAISTVDLHTGEKTSGGQGVTTSPLPFIIPIKIDFQEEYLDEILGSFADIGDLKSKIYVEPELEHIFEPKEGDIGMIKGRGEVVAYRRHNWNISSTEKLKIDIIIRDNKQFFQADAE